ncbi:MAG: four helix bundle protein [Chthoniobacterales bacterium]
MSRTEDAPNTPALAPTPLPDHPVFDHEKPEVYRDSIAFCGWVGEFLSKIEGKTAAKDQLDRASTSIPLNIAEGNGKFSTRDRARFLEMARGSALECAACLDVLVVRKLSTFQQVSSAKQQLARIVRMLIGLLKRFSDRADVLREDEDGYLEEEHEQDQEQEQEKKK